MAGTAALIAAIMGAAAEAISSVVKLVTAGQIAEAQTVVDRFVATTRLQLDGDREKAEAILRRRHPEDP